MFFHHFFVTESMGLTWDPFINGSRCWWPSHILLAAFGLPLVHEIPLTALGYKWEATQLKDASGMMRWRKSGDQVAEIGKKFNKLLKGVVNFWQMLRVRGNRLKTCQPCLCAARVSIRWIKCVCVCTLSLVHVRVCAPYYVNYVSACGTKRGRESKREG